jgi:hypothetical protein
MICFADLLHGRSSKGSTFIGNSIQPRPSILFDIRNAIEIDYCTR